MREKLKKWQNGLDGPQLCVVDPSMQDHESDKVLGTQLTPWAHEWPFSRPPITWPPRALGPEFGLTEPKTAGSDARTPVAHAREVGYARDDQ